MSHPQAPQQQKRRSDNQRRKNNDDIRSPTTMQAFTSLHQDVKEKLGQPRMRHPLGRCAPQKQGLARHLHMIGDPAPDCGMRPKVEAATNGAPRVYQAKESR
jgi:hypothetical protein